MRGTGQSLYLPIAVVPLETVDEPAAEPALVVSVRRPMWPRRLPYGYVRGPGPVGVPVVHPAQGAVVRQIYLWYLQMGSIGAVLRELARHGMVGPTGRPWSRGTLHRVLTNALYAGYPRPAAAQYTNTPIVARHEFSSVQAQLLKASRQGRHAWYMRRLAAARRTAAAAVQLPAPAGPAPGNP